jgi:hypothetical protein
MPIIIGIPQQNSWNVSSGYSWLMASAEARVKGNPDSRKESAEKKTA